MRYSAPTSVEEAVVLLASDAGARVFAGATDLIPQMRAGRPAPALLVDLKEIPDLTAIGRDQGSFTVGAATPAADLAGDAEVSAVLPGLCESAGLIGSDQIQNRASLGGNLCNASPAADTVPALLVNDARVVIAGNGATRTLPVADVVTGPGATSLGPCEFVVKFEIDAPPPNTADAYLRFIPRSEMDIAVVGAAASVTLDDSGNCTSAAVALGAVAPTAIRVPAAEARLVGHQVDEAALAEVAVAANAACDPIDDKRGTVEFRRHVAGVLARRAVRLAADRAGERGGAQ